MEVDAGLVADSQATTEVEAEPVSMSSEANQFPSIQGNNLNKIKKTVPDDFVDKDLIVIVAFQQWHQPLVDESIENLENEELDLTHNIIEVPTIRKSTKLNEIYLDGVMRRAIREDKIRNRTDFCKWDITPIR